MECPRCKGEFKTQVVNEIKGELTYNVCKSCEGIWIKPEDLQPLEKLTNITVIEQKEIPDKEVQNVLLRCPEHPNRIMKKYKHPKDEDVIYDQCPTCRGIWLDKGELEAIQEQAIGSLTLSFFKWFLGVS